MPHRLRTADRWSRLAAASVLAVFVVSVYVDVVLGAGVQSVKAVLSPSRNGLAYVGSVMGREIVYERSREQVQADIDRLNPKLRQSSRRR